MGVENLVSALNGCRLIMEREDAIKEFP